MTLEEIKELIEEEVLFTIVCETIEERFDVSQMLLDLGVAHGDSGYSRAVMDGSISQEYMNPFVRYGEKRHTIGYGACHYVQGERITFSEIIWPDPIEADTFDNDLLDMLTK